MLTVNQQLFRQAEAEGINLNLPNNRHTPICFIREQRSLVNSLLYDQL